MRVNEPPSRLRVLGVSALALLSACHEEPSGALSPPSLDQTGSAPSQDVVAIPQFPELQDFIPAVEIGIPPEPRSFEVSDAALVDAVRATGGEIAIRVRPPGAQSSRVTGVIPCHDASSSP